jgi:DNA polymerase-1
LQKPKLRLNIRQPTDGAERLQTAAKRKKAASETLEEAWQRILSMKNSEADQRKLLEVKAAMESGVIGRDPASLAKRFSKAEALRLHKKLVEIKREETLRNMVENTPENYWLITDEAKLDEFLAILDDEEEIVFDVETTGTDVWKDHIVGHVITAIKADIHAYIPTRHKTDTKQLPNDYVVAKLKPYYENESIGKLAHNAKFDIHMLDREGVDLRGLTWDTQEAMRMLNENEPSFALKNLVTKYLGIPSQTYGDLFGSIGFDEVSDLRVALAYAAKDGDVTRKLRDFQLKHLRKMPAVLEYYQTVEVPLIKTLVHMESTGYDIDTDYAKQYGAELKKEIDELHAQLIDVLGDINIDSPAQLKKALSKAIGENLKSTDAKRVLKPLANKHPIIKTLLDYKAKVKLYSTYISVIPNLIDPKTGKLHTNFNGNGAKTGRMSSGKGDDEGGVSKDGSVNLQNQPYDARKLFVAPPGYVILGGDWSQQEYRALAYFSQEPKLIENYLNGNDLYANVASEIFNKPIEECGDGSVYRKLTKVILLAVAYGTGPKTLSLQLGKSQEEAKAFLKSFNERFPAVAKWIESNRNFVQKHGFVWMDRRQRKRRLPHAKNRNSDYWYTSVFTQSTNAIIQGSAAIQTKTTMNELYKLCERKTAEGRGTWRMWCVVHDEALLLVPDTITRDDIAEFENVMLHTYVFGNVPNKCDIEISRRWGEGMKVNEFFTGNVLREDYPKEEDYEKQIEIVRKNWQGR